MTMTHGGWIVLAALAAGTPAFAQDAAVYCTQHYTWNSSLQIGRSATLMYVVGTGRPYTGCPGAVEVEASIEGVTGSAAAAQGGFTAQVTKQVPVAGAGTYATLGRHKHAFVALVSVYHSASSADVTLPEPEMDCSVFNGGGDYYVWDSMEGRCVPFLGSPIIVDTGRDGYRLTSVKNGVHFDLDVDGVPELTAWTRRDSDDAFLAMDRNRNGLIDNGTELFGNHTPAYADRTEVTTLNGFEALAFLQGSAYGPSRLDHQIDRADAAFAQLLLWRDANHNGLSEPDELTPLGAAGVRAISTTYKETKRVDRFGNEFRQKGRIAWSDGYEDAVFDVWLQHDR
jgi:hypothetical protein